MSRKTKATNSHAKLDDADPAYLLDVVNRQMDMVRAYKARQDDVVVSLAAIQMALANGLQATAKNLIAEILARDLKQAKDRFDNRQAALVIAVRAMEGRLDLVDTLSQMELLDPESFVAMRDKPLAVQA